MSKAVFLDKDGTVIEDLPYNVDPAQVVFLPGAWEGLTLLGETGYRLVIVTNQSGVARGYFSEKDLGRLADFFHRQFRRRGLELAGFYFCPHLPAGKVAQYSVSCPCRKPEPGLILRASAELGIDPCSSWCIGNAISDIQAGQAAGCATLLLNSGGAKDLVDAAMLVNGKNLFFDE